ncbi:MAG: hypothetical protein JNL11_13450 [Bdellovibrionaceae bacterium]|nr:hypothetical protein [Pseudobdellovibrionaceae bacterium]
MGVPHDIAIIWIPLFWIYSNGFLTFITSFRINKNVQISLFLMILFTFISIENGGNHVTLEHGIIFFSLLSYNIYLSKESIKNKYLFFFLYGLSVLSIAMVKQVGILLLPYFLFIVLDRNFFLNKKESLKKISCFVFGAFTALYITFHSFKANVNQIYSQLFHRIANYLADSPSNQTFLLSELLRSPYTVSLFASTLILAYFFISSQNLKLIKKMEILMLIGLVFGYAFARTIRNYPHYTLNSWFPILILFALFFQFEGTKNRKFLFTLFFLLTVGSVGTLVTRWNTSYKFSEINSFFLPSAKFIRESTTPDQPILQLGEEPVIEFLSYRRPQRMDIEWAWKYSKFSDDGNPTVVINNYNRIEEVREKELVLSTSGYKVIFEHHLGKIEQPNRVLKFWIKK